jgi:alpha-mannosidase
MRPFEPKQPREMGISIPKLALAITAIFALVVGVLTGTQASAQTLEQAAKVLKPYSEQSRSVVQRLTLLNRLPAEEWRYHAGDLAHGESPDLDDSSWQLVKPRMEAPQDAVWFRRWVEVPSSLQGYDLTGARIWFRLEAYANGPMPEIIYFNGRRVALGDDLEPIVLFEKAKPGDKVLVAVKLLHTVDKKTFAETELKIDHAESRPNPEDLRLEILSAALLIPGFSKNAPADTSTLEKAVGAVDLAALDAKDQAKFDASLKQAQSTLEALKPTL